MAGHEIRLMRRAAQAGVGSVANETPQRLRRICDVAASWLDARRLVIALQEHADLVLRT